jgi:hypothetical protein
MDRKTYQLTNLELAFLVGLLNLDPHPESVLMDWFSAADVDEMMSTKGSECIDHLLTEGYLTSHGGEWYIDKDLAKIVRFAAEAITDVVIHMHYADQIQMGYFAQAGESMFQYWLDGHKLTMHSPIHIEALADLVFPEMIEVQNHEGLREQMPYSAYILLLEACRGFLDSMILDEINQGFTLEELMEDLSYSTETYGDMGWLGINAAFDLDTIPIHSYIQDLTSRELLHTLEGNRLTLGKKALPLFQAATDPNTYAVACSIHTKGREEAQSGSWLYGNGRLFHVKTVGEGEVEVEQVFSQGVALEWLRNLLVESSKVKPESVGVDLESYERIPMKKDEAPSSGVLHSSTPIKKTRFSRLVSWALSASISLFSILVIGLVSSLILSILQGDMELKDLLDQIQTAPQQVFAFGGDHRPVEEEGQAAVTHETSPTEKVIPTMTEELSIPTEAEVFSFEAVRDQLSVEEIQLIEDGYGDWYLIGVLHNAGPSDMGWVKLQVELSDSNGNILHEAEGSTRLPAVAGSESPFDIYLRGLEEVPKDVSINVVPKDAKEWSGGELLQLEILNTYLRLGGYQSDRVFLLGEMHNPHDQPMRFLVRAFMRDDEGQLLVGTHSSAVQSNLLPGERVPFGIEFYPAEIPDPLRMEDHIQLYLAAYALQDFKEPAISLSQFQISYVDINGDFHILGRVLNEETDPRNVILIGGIYDSEGRVVEVCRQWIFPRNLPSEAITTYDLSCWDILIQMDENLDLLQKAQTFDIFVDRQASLDPQEKTAMALKTGDLSVEESEGQLTIAGTILNATDSYDEVSVIVTVWNTIEDIPIGMANQVLMSGEQEFETYVSYNQEYYDEVNIEIRVKAYGY